MFFNEDHLRITKVKTIDGVTPIYDEQRRPELKIIYAPDTKETRKLFDEANSRLPTHLKMKIERVKGYTPQSAPTVNVSDLEKEIAELKAQNAKLIENQQTAKEANKSESENGDVIKSKKETVK